MCAAFMQACIQSFGCDNIWVMLQAPSSVLGQDTGPPAQPEPIRVPAEPMIRDTTASLSLPEEVDDLMRDHIRFLYREGIPLCFHLFSWTSLSYLIYLWLPWLCTAHTIWQALALFESQ